jgi:hypothetical protein
MASSPAKSVPIDQLTASNDDMITGAQIRAGRALLNWSTAVLAKRSGVPRADIVKAEGVDGVPRIGAKHLATIKTALNEGGVKLIGEGGMYLEG